MSNALALLDQALKAIRHDVQCEIHDIPHDNCSCGTSKIKKKLNEVRTMLATETAHCRECTAPTTRLQCSDDLCCLGAGWHSHFMFDGNAYVGERIATTSDAVIAALFREPHSTVKHMRAALVRTLKHDA